MRRFAAILLLVVCAASATAQSALKVSKIEIRPIGPATVSEELIRSNLRMKEGDPYIRLSVDDDVKNLYSTGFFYTIRVGESNAANGVELTYFIQAKPRLTDIKFTGNQKYDNDKLLKKISSKVGDPLDERKLFTDCQELRKLYEKNGYPGTTVSNSVSIEEATGRGTATFEIAETRKVKIEKVEFVGATAFSQKTLRKQVKTRKRWFMSWLTGSGIYKADQFEEDREKLTGFYRDKGYIDFEIKDVKLERPTPKTMVVRIFVSEGIQYKVGAISFKGTKLLPTNAVSPAFTPPPIPKKAGPERAEAVLQRQLNKNFKLKEGSTFIASDLRRSSEAVEDYYGSKGYIDVNGENLRVAKIPNTEKGTMDLEYTINEGQKSYIEKIEIKGNTKTKDRVIRRELAVSPGEVFDMVRVKVSKSRLEGLQYFDKVDARPEPTDALIQDRKNLVIGVEEKNTGNLSLGAGFSSVDAVVGYVEFAQGNFDIANPPLFTGAGQKFRARVQIGTQRKDIQTTFIEPWFLGRKLSLGVDLYHRELSYQSLESLYDEERTGVKLSLSRALGSDFLIGSVSTTLEQVGIMNVDTNAPQFIHDEEGRAMLAKFGASLAYDTRNNTTLPNRGQRTELFGEFVTMDKQFYKVELKSAWYFPGFQSGDVLEIAGRIGVADSLNNSDIPFYERYYLGGMTSLRGYRYREIGPRESFNTYTLNGTNVVTGTAWEPAGGNTYWFITAEYSTPIIERLRLAVFYDIGMVYPGSFSFSPDPSRGPGYNTGSYADNWGIGIRLNLPIGPLRLDYGMPITAPPGISTSGRFQFGAGYTREF